MQLDDDNGGAGVEKRYSDVTKALVLCRYAVSFRLWEKFKQDRKCLH